MEAFMYRCHPLMHKLVELLGQKVIGQVRAIHASFAFHGTFNPNGRLWTQESAGGGILDVGCYPVSLARLVAGVAMGKPFADPLEVKGAGVLNPTTRIDEYAVAVMKFPGDIVATVATGVGVNMDNAARIFGTEGNIIIPSPWVPARDGGSVSIMVQRQGEKAPREMLVQTPRQLYSFEADTVAANLDKRQASSPAMSWDDSLGNMKALDSWRQSFNFVYDFEQQGKAPTITGRPLAVRPVNNMKYGSIPGVNKKMSRLVMGVDNITAGPHVAVLWDDFFQRGGTAWDTAHIYGGGQSERALGAWVKSRSLRQQVVIIDKGAHTPCCDPLNLTREHRLSLERLQMDHVDIYMMHRDNPAIPVGEFVDVLNEHVAAGTMKVIGASNWSMERIDEFNAWAKKNGKRGFGVVSNNFSLARMVKAVWAGCLACSDPQGRAWFQRTQMPLLPWSSQARGFFVPGRAATDRLEDRELVDSWYSQDNFRRQARAFELAQQRNVEPIAIALAYVLCQPFPTFPMIGPRTLCELHSSLPALGVELSPAEMKYLNLEEG